MSWKHLFRRAFDAAPDRLHLAAHSHHLWPDASFDGQYQAWDDAVRLAGRKWDRVMDEIWPRAQAEVASELRLLDPSSIVFGLNTHELITRLVSALERSPVRVLTTDGEFHSFRRQCARWEEAGTVMVERVPVAPRDTLTERFVAAAQAGHHDLIFISHVMYGTGLVFDGLGALAELARPEGPWVVIDGYHGFMAVETDFSPFIDRLFYTAGGYKYAMAGEGVAFLHAPNGFGLRPVNTGWYAEFDDLALQPGQVGYASDARRFMGSTFDPSGLYRFVSVRGALEAEGLSTAVISEHAVRLQEQLLHMISGTALGDAELLNPLTDGPRARFLAFRSPCATRWQAELLARDIITDVRGDVLRIGIGLYHDEADIARFGREATILA